MKVSKTLGRYHEYCFQAGINYQINTMTEEITSFASTNFKSHHHIKPTHTRTQTTTTTKKKRRETNRCIEI